MFEPPTSIQSVVLKYPSLSAGTTNVATTPSLRAAQHQAWQPRQLRHAMLRHLWGIKDTTNHKRWVDGNEETIPSV